LIRVDDPCLVVRADIAVELELVSGQLERRQRNVGGLRVVSKAGINQLLIRDVRAGRDALELNVEGDAVVRGNVALGRFIVCIRLPRVPDV